MPLKKIVINTSPADSGKRLDQVLADRIPQILKQPLSKGKIRKLVIAGAVYLNGKRVRIASKGVMSQARIDVYIDLEKLLGESGGQFIPFEMTPERILFEDQYVIVVDKPAGVPTQPTLDEARVNLFLAVKKYIASREGIPLAQVYLALHHRLDRDTSGVILMSKSLQANAGLAEGFSSRQNKKIYQALAHRENGRALPADSWSIQNYLGVDKSSPQKKKRFCSLHSGGDPAHTDFKILEKLEQAYWIEAQPHTGRTHQIRVHLSESGYPILGDVTYRGRKTVGAIEIPRTLLHALSLTFIHPIHQNRIAIQSGLPGDFKKCLEALRRGRSDS
jgi:RluA family pseudouridine synthase